MKLFILVLALFPFVAQGQGRRVYVDETRSVFNLPRGTTLHLYDRFPLQSSTAAAQVPDMDCEFQYPFIEDLFVLEPSHEFVVSRTEYPTTVEWTDASGTRHSDVKPLITVHFEPARVRGVDFRLRLVCDTKSLMRYRISQLRWLMDLDYPEAVKVHFLGE